MLALLYFAVAICLGDRICRRFYSFIASPHRWAAAFSVGCLTAGWITYLIGLMFARALVPLFWGNLLFFALAIAVFKATLVVLFFMHVKYSTHLTWAVVAGGIFWFAILITITMSDYLTRAWQPYGSV